MSAYDQITGKRPAQKERAAIKGLVSVVAIASAAVVAPVAVIPVALGLAAKHGNDALRQNKHDNRARDKAAKRKPL